MMWSIYRFLPAIFVLASVIAQPASANLIRYDVSSTGVVNCGGGTAPHGLWTGSLNLGGGCGSYFDIQAPSYLDITEDTGMPADTTGHLFGTAINPNGYTATFDIFLTGFLETSTQYKQEGGPSYDPGTDTPDVDFFTSATGQIDIENASLLYKQTFTFSSFAGGYFFQYGTSGSGANAKDGAQGASAWVNVSGSGVNGHWDFNLNSNRVPEPPTLSLLALGLIGIGVAARRRRAAETAPTPA